MTVTIRHSTTARNADTVDDVFFHRRISTYHITRHAIRRSHDSDSSGPLRSRLYTSPRRRPYGPGRRAKQLSRRRQSKTRRLTKSR